MPDSEIDQTVQKVLDVRKVGADYEEHQQASPLDIPVDPESRISILGNFSRN